MKPFLAVVFLCYASLTFAQIPGVRFTPDALGALSKKSSLVVTATVENRTLITGPIRVSETTETPKYAEAGSYDHLPLQEVDFPASNVIGRLYHIRVIQVLKSKHRPKREVTLYLYGGMVAVDSDQLCGVNEGETYLFFLNPLNKNANIGLLVDPVVEESPESPGIKIPFQPSSAYEPVYLYPVGETWSAIPLKGHAAYVRRVKSDVWKSKLQFWHWF